MRPLSTSTVATCYYTLNRHRECKLTETSRSIIGWRRGVVDGGVRRRNEVNARRARLVLGWVTVFRRVYHPGM